MLTACACLDAVPLGPGDSSREASAGDANVCVRVIGGDRELAIKAATWESGQGAPVTALLSALLRIAAGRRGLRDGDRDSGGERDEFGNALPETGGTSASTPPRGGERYFCRRDTLCRCLMRRTAASSRGSCSKLPLLLKRSSISLMNALLAVGPRRPPAGPAGCWGGLTAVADGRDLGRDIPAAAAGSLSPATAPLRCVSTCTSLQQCTLADVWGVCVCVCEKENERER